VAAAITDTANYSLACNFAGKSSIALNWSLVTKNTDGSTITDLAGYKIYRGTSAGNLTLLTTVASPSTLTYTDAGLAPGTYFYGITAYTTAGVESQQAILGSSVASGTSTLTASVKITVPAAPTGGTVN